MRTFLEACAEVEDLAAEIYRELSRHCDGNRRICDLLTSLAEDEEGHARQLRLAANVSFQERFQGLSEKAGDPFALRVRARALLEHVRSAGIDESDIIETAIELERDFIRIHADCSLVFKDQTIRKLFSGLSRSDEEHVAALKQYLRDYLEGKR